MIDLRNRKVPFQLQRRGPDQSWAVCVVHLCKKDKQFAVASEVGGSFVFVICPVGIDKQLVARSWKTNRGDHVEKVEFEHHLADANLRC